MRGLRKSVLAGVVALLGCAAAGEAAAGILPPGEHNRLVRLLDSEPMVFFVAQGPANSCGQGCNEWIAAVGRFDFDTGQRFRTFVEKLNGRSLPVFFHSRGGWGKAGVEVATVLRERRMTVAVGRTETKQCRIFDKKDKACEERIEKGQSIPARLTTKDAQCHSACVIAFIGGSSRRIAADAHLGVHQGRFMTEPGRPVMLYVDGRQRKSIQQNLYQEWGIDPRLVELEDKAPHERIYVLSRNEITRIGLETKDKNFETSWTTFESDALGFMVGKSITTRTSVSPPQYLTTRIQLYCNKVGRMFLNYRRELPFGSGQATTSIQVKADDRTLSFQTQTKTDTESGSHYLVDRYAVMDVAGAKNLAMIERKEGDQEGLETKLSIDGLEAAAKEFHGRCVPTNSQPPAPSMATVMPMPRIPGLTPWAPILVPPTTGYSPNSKTPEKVTFKTTWSRTPVTRQGTSSKAPKMVWVRYPGTQTAKQRTSSKPGTPRVVWVKEPWAIAAKPRVYYSNSGSQTQR